MDNNSIATFLQLSEEHFQQNVEPEQRKALIERAIRSKALKFGGTEPKVAEVSAFVKFVIDVAKKEICSKTITIQILQDIFDVSSVNCCERLFGIVEDNIDTWKTAFFFDYCKNLVLRMCNDLLKRLSRTIDTTFCGRILILLANFLPFAEKSGLNLTGQFNTFNVTTYDREKKEQPFDEILQQPNTSTISTAVAGEDDIEVGEIREHRDSVSGGAISVDSNLYAKFWELQKFFANPNLLFEYNAFKDFHKTLSDVLAIFSANKLERVQQKRNNSPTVHQIKAKFPQNGGDVHVKMEIDSEEQAGEQLQFFAKYLTSQKLFPLQLADSQFRRYFLLQYLIIANYLLLKVKLKDTFTLTTLQEEEVRELTDKCFALLRETHPNGSLFADAVKKVLSRERLWSTWKNEGCPDLITPLLNAQTIEKYAAFKRKAVAQCVAGQLDLGNKEMTRLWNIQPNNLLACRSQQRNCTPDLVQFLSDALDELDPEQQVDEQYQSVNDEKYQWMGSRFLLFTSDQYLSSNVQESNRVPTVANASAVSTSTASFLKKTIKLTAENLPLLKERAEQIQLATKKIEEAAKKNEEAAKKSEETTKKIEETMKKIEDSEAERKREHSANGEKSEKRESETKSKKREREKESENEKPKKGENARKRESRKREFKKIQS
ncbi:hypothetical protein niasHT_037023 [Heterodera trifolii]|uniref:THO complex subunit 1 n=1 Tax=Heterodera trifolii TaxID=157864 RepID=A0ABD2J0X5_9BILA